MTTAPDRASPPVCECGIYAIGECVDCGRPLCPEHGSMAGGRFRCERHAKPIRAAERREQAQLKREAAERAAAEKAAKQQADRERAAARLAVEEAKQRAESQASAAEAGALRFWKSTRFIVTDAQRLNEVACLGCSTPEVPLVRALGSCPQPACPPIWILAGRDGTETPADGPWCDGHAQRIQDLSPEVWFDVPQHRVDRADDGDEESLRLEIPHRTVCRNCGTEYNRGPWINAGKLCYSCVQDGVGALPRPPGEAAPYELND